MKSRQAHQQKQTHALYVWSLILMMALPIVAGAAPPLPHSMQKMAALQAKLLMSVRPRMTFTKVKGLLPSGTLVSVSPYFEGGDSGFGNIFTLKGAINGQLSFLDRRRKSNFGQIYHRSDPINFVEFNAFVPANEKHYGQLYIQALSRYIGRPTNKKWDGEHWNVNWSLPNGRQVSYGLGRGELDLFFPDTMYGGE